MSTLLIALAVATGWLILATALALAVSRVIDARDVGEPDPGFVVDPADAAWETVTPR